MGVLPEQRGLVQPLFLKGGDKACLLIHGFTGSAFEMRELGGFLHRGGFTVHVISLSGHGGTPRDLENVKAEDWINDVLKGYELLRKEHTRIYPVGLSMGALLAIILASRYTEIPAGVLLAPAITLRSYNKVIFPLLKFSPGGYYYTKPDGSNILDEDAKRRHIAYNSMPLRSIYEFYRVQKMAKRAIKMTSCPFLIIFSKKDGTLSEKSVRIIEKRAARVEKVILNNSGHVITVDREKESVFNYVLEFLNKN